MLEKPGLPDDLIRACLAAGYGLTACEITFLPLGADVNTAVYQVVAEGLAYFLKLRSGPFDPTTVLLARFLSDQGIEAIIPPLPAVNGGLWAELGSYKTILYPFVAGRNGYEMPLSERQWIAFGEALKAIHGLALPLDLSGRLRRETFAPYWRERVLWFLDQALAEPPADPVAAEVAALLTSQRLVILELIERAGQLAHKLVGQPAEFVLCHSDLHAGNLHLTEAGALYLVDWDEPLLAPKERDLMYIGGGLLGGWLAPQQEEALFYPAYGPAQLDQAALAYYRYERIIQDIAAYCEELLLSAEGGVDRPKSLGYLQSNFLPDHTIAIAYQQDLSGTGR